MTACTVRLPIFEGPLDLLLHLIKRNEVQVNDIPIATITDQYLAMLEELPELNLDGAGEYLVMASTLVYIKSRMLLPAPEEDEELEEDPRHELVQQLLEYQRYRDVALALGERAVLDRDVFARDPEALEPAEPGESAEPRVRDASLADLLDALREVMRRLRPPAVHEVEREEIPIGRAVERVLARFALVEQVVFGSLFPPDATRADVIVTFLALLELIRLRVVRARQPERFGEIALELAVDSVEVAAERVRDLGHLEEWRGGGDGRSGDGAIRVRLRRRTSGGFRR
ncbi:MAG: segregation/condensation protein A [Deltaproteobacteria bacterium]|nr:MAG: segregation/condensation protein A [Deltaproteobacteria bacterium]